MKKAAEMAVFGTLAVGLHVFLMADWPDSGSEAGGIGGDALATLAGATPQIETMVATWTRPPQTQQIVDVVQPIVDISSPLLPMASVRMDDAPNAELKMAVPQAPKPPRPPKPDVTTAPPPRPEPAPKPKPEPEPKQTQAPKPKPKAQPAKRAQRASAGAAAQKAAGSGGSAQAGNQGRSATKTLSPGKEAKLIAVWGARIRSQIERRKRYPSNSRAKGQVVLRVSVARNGQLNGVTLHRSSGHPDLDAAAIGAVNRAGTFPAAPKQLTKSVYTFSLPVNFGR